MSSDTLYELVQTGGQYLILTLNLMICSVSVRWLRSLLLRPRIPPVTQPAWASGMSFHMHHQALTLPAMQPTTKSILPVCLTEPLQSLIIGVGVGGSHVSAKLFH